MELPDEWTKWLGSLETRVDPRTRIFDPKEDELIRRAYKKATKVEIARMLHISMNTLQKRIRELELDSE